MGWMYTSKPKHVKVKDFFQSQFGNNVEILDCKVKNLRTAYMAVKEKATGSVCAVVCLLNYVPNDVYNFGYKDMDESCGPNADECPESVLNLLTETDNEYALEWRKACRKNIADRKSKPRLKVGDSVVFDDRLTFCGEQIQEFDVYLPKRNLFKNRGRCYQINGWRKMEYHLKDEVTV